jgi:hypothetical protein
MRKRTESTEWPAREQEVAAVAPVVRPGQLVLRNQLPSQVGYETARIGAPSTPQSSQAIHPRERVAKLRAFWEGITTNPLFDWTAAAE